LTGYTSTIRRRKYSRNSMAKTVKTRPESFCFIDVESYSDVDVDYGAVNYFASAKAGIHCICYKIDDGDTRRIWLGGKIKPLPKELLAHKGYFVAHNWFFEWCAFRRFYPTTRLAEIEPWLCTAAIARRYHIAGSRAALDEVAIRCGAGSTKLHEGKRLIATYSYPRKDTGEFIPVPDADKQAWLDYCAHDVVSIHFCSEEQKKPNTSRHNSG
ncbi:MAG: hypothetical protein RML34_11750, partial [Leptospiraceae bacterium]|nr:hypothetical protein [Leptospiraceae bacterium]